MFKETYAQIAKSNENFFINRKTFYWTRLVFQLFRCCGLWLLAFLYFLNLFDFLLDFIIFNFLSRCLLLLNFWSRVLHGFDVLLILHVFYLHRLSRSVVKLDWLVDQLSNHWLAPWICVQSDWLVWFVFSLGLPRSFIVVVISIFVLILRASFSTNVVVLLLTS